MTEEIQAWLSTNELVFHRMEAYHRHRVAAVTSGTTPFRLHDEGRLIVHLIPEAAIRSRVRFAASELKNHAQKLRPLADRGGMSRFNADGFVLFDGRNEVRAYTQLHRDGRLEAVMSETVFEAKEMGGKILRDTICEQAVIDLVPAYLTFCAEIGIKPPVWLFASLTGCQSVRIQADRHFPSDYAIDRPVVHLPEMEIADFNPNAEAFLRPLCDALWNAAGFERCFTYNEAGNRQDRRR